MILQIPQPQPPAEGLAFICQLDGKILEIIQDDFQLSSSLGVDLSLQNLVDERSVIKLNKFLAELADNKAAFGWEMNIPYDGKLMTLHFAGGVAEGKLLILAARSRSEVYQLYNSLIQTHSDFVDSLKEIISTQAEMAQERIDRDSGFFDELSSLNNELATMQRQLAKQNVELERLNQEKNHYLGMAAHDLRGPLSAIYSYSEFVLNEAGDVLSEEHLRFLSIIQSSSNYMAALVDDLLDVSIIESGQLHLYPEYVEIDALVKERISINSILAKKKRIGIMYCQDDELPLMNVDPAKISQVIDNLTSNAIKYSPEGGSVEVRLCVKKNDIVISVKDQGQGIPAGEIDKLFQLFGRTSVRSPHGEKSTGLGLAIAHRIVQGHGGKIWIESEEGRGSTFFVSLPIENQS